MTDEDDRGGSQWHLDRKVPIALILAIAMQTMGGVWWAATQSARTDALERAAVAIGPQSEKIVRLETKMDAIKDTLTEIKNLIRPGPTR